MTDPPKKFKSYKEQVDANVVKFRPHDAPTSSYNPLTPRGNAERNKQDHTRANPEPRKPTVSERLREMQASISDPNISKVARGSRQVEANRLADEVRKSRK